MSGASAPRARRTVSRYSRSAPGLILIFTLRYPAASAASARSKSAAGLSWMPSEMPVAIFSRSPPTSRASGTPRTVASSPQRPISTAAFAIRCPRRSVSRIGAASEAAASFRPKTLGAIHSRITSQATSTVSGE